MGGLGAGAEGELSGERRCGPVGVLTPLSQPKHPDRVPHDRAGPAIDCACKSVRTQRYIRRCKESDNRPEAQFGFSLFYMKGHPELAKD